MQKLVLLGLLATSALGGLTPRRPLLPLHGRIIGGTPAEAGEFPSMVSLQLKLKHMCSASIISATWALTSGGCVDGETPSELTLLVGSLDMTQGGTRHRVARYFRHELYDPYNLPYLHNIGIIEVVRPFEMSDFVQPIKLPELDEATEAGSPASVIGWGSTVNLGPYSDELLKIDVEVWDQDTCVDLFYGIQHEIYPTEICAGLPPAKSIGPCSGDGGSPLIVNETVVGTVNYYNGCAEPGFPQVYTRVASYREWIRVKTGI